MAKGKAYSRRSKAQQRKIDRYISRFYGTTKTDHSQALRDIREGRAHPFARSEDARVPNRFRLPNLVNAAWRNIRAQLGDHLGWKGQRSDDHVRENLRRASTVALIAIANATEDELTVWAEAGASNRLTDKQREREALDAHPGWGKKDVGFFDTYTRWHSVFWYH